MRILFVFGTILLSSLQNQPRRAKELHIGEILYQNGDETKQKKTDLMKDFVNLIPFSFAYSAAQQSTPTAPPETVSSAFEILIRQEIKDFEKNEGEIEIPQAQTKQIDFAVKKEAESPTQPLF